MHIMHSCDNPSCVNPAHLSAGTAADNIQDAARKGRMSGPKLRGMENPASKLTDEAVRKIRIQLSRGRVMRHIARDFGVDQTVVHRIRDNKSWSHVV